MDRLEAINITKSIIGIPYRIDKRLLDMKCLREAVINAIAHNNWIEGVPPIIYVFNNRIEIISTGGLPKNLSKEEFYLGISKPRNKELMRIFSDLDLVERSGYGVPKIINIYGKEVFEITDNFIRVILPFDKEVMRLIESEEVADKPAKVADKTVKVADKSEKVADKRAKVADKSVKVADKSEKVADKLEKVADKLNKTQELILEIIKKDPYIRIKDLMSQLF